MFKIAVITLALALGGCAVSGGFSVGPQKYRMFEIHASGQGGETFCWEGVGWNEIGIGPVGWGTHECRRSSTTSLVD